MIGKELGSEEEHSIPGCEAEVDTNLSHLPRKIRCRFERMLWKNGLVSESLYDLRPADVSIRHHFELTTDAPGYFKRTRQSPKHNRIIWEDLKKIVPERSEWSSPVLISTKNDGQHRFCMDYRFLNLLMKGDRRTILRTQ